MGWENETGRMDYKFFWGGEVPVDEIVEEWRSRSSKGRYEHAMWTAAGLEEPQSRWEKKEGLEPTWAGEDDGARAFEGDEAMDNLRAHPHQGRRGIE